MPRSSLISWFDLTKWIFLGTLGWLLGALFLMGMADAIPEAGEPLGLTVIFFLFGIIIGATQWLALKRVLPPSASWIAATGLGFLIAYFVWIKSFALGLDDLLLASIASGLIFGLPMGLLQSQSWRRHHGRVRWWTTATVLGFTGGFVLAGLASNWSLPSPTVARIDILPTLVPPAAASLVTGLVLKNHLLSQGSSDNIPKAVPANPSLERTGDSAPEARDDLDTGS